MTVSRVTSTFTDGGLESPTTLDLPPAFVGCSSSGDEDTPTLVTSPAGLVETFGYGPAVSACAKTLREAGGPVLFCRTATATAGQLGAYCQQGAGVAAAGTVSSVTGTSTAIPALTGTPDQPYAIKIVVVDAASNIAGNPTVKVSLDGGLTYLATDAVDVSATPQAIGDTGLLLAFADGTFVATDSWTANGANCPTPGDATGASVLTITGTPRDRYEAAILVTRAAATAGDGTGAIRYSLDDGATYAAEVPVPTSRAVVLGDTGITVTFSAASLVAGDEYFFKTAAPVFDATGLDAALRALEAVGVEDHEGVNIVGPIDATYFDEVSGSHDRLLAASVPRYFLAHARDQGSALQGESVATWVTSIIGASPGFAGKNAKMVAVCAGVAAVKDALHGNAVMRRSVLFPIAARLAAIEPAEHPGRGRTGPLALESLVHDFADDDLDALDSAGFLGAQSIRGLAGYYATDRTRAAAGSDYSEIMRVRVMCRAARAALARLAQEANESPDVNNDGTIRADVADGLDASVTTFVARELGANVTSVSVRVDRTVNIVSTGRLPFKIRLVPRAYAKAITLDLGFTLGSN